MIEALLIGLLYILLYAIIIAIVIYIILAVLQTAGVPLPPPIPRLIWLAFGVIILIMVISLLLGWRPSLPFRAGITDRPVVAAAASTRA